MTKEEKLYAEECNCPEIQNGWKPKTKDNYVMRKDIEWANTQKGEVKTEWILLIIYAIGQKYEVFNRRGARPASEWRKHCIFLPSFDQLLDILGERFSHLALYKKKYRCVLNGKVVALRDLIYNGSTPKLACLLAVKEVLKEDAQEERDLVMQTRPFVKRALKEEMLKRLPSVEDIEKEIAYIYENFNILTERKRRDLLATAIHKLVTDKLKEESDE